MSRRQLISSDEAVHAKCQHTAPCSDCPFSRNALRGWLGGGTADEWIITAHGDHEMPCHTLKGAQCVGAAIYRANVCKKPRFDDFRASADREAVFATPMEFKAHHSAAPEVKP